MHPVLPHGLLRLHKQLVGLHKEHHVFPIKLAVTRVSGTGVDAVFMGVIKPVASDPNTVKAWVMAGVLHFLFNAMFCCCTHVYCTTVLISAACSLRDGIYNGPLLCLAGGLMLCADVRYMDWFGTIPSECSGRPFSSIALDGDRLTQ
jgi:hypothetical protein